jgi:hypothetical protein
MKLTGPQMRLLTSIVDEPTVAQDEINAKLSTRNVVANLVKVGALEAGLGISCNGVDYEVTDEGLTALGYSPALARASMPGNETIAVEAASDLTAEIKDAIVIPAGVVDAQIEFYAGSIYAGSDDRGCVPASVRVIDLRTGTLGALPMPEIESADEPVPFLPVQVNERTIMTFPARAIKLGLPSKVIHLAVGTQERNEHKATENYQTKQIVCECGITVKTRNLLKHLHKTTRIIPYVKEI